MMYHLDEDFTRKLDEFNQSQGGPARIELAWHQGKQRWQVFAVPQGDSFHPLAKGSHTQKLLTSMPDQSGRTGILLFTWQGADGSFLPPSDLLFQTLRWADTFRSRRHYEETITDPEAKREIATKKELISAAAAAGSYWATLDRLAVSPHIKGPGDWRHRYR